MFRGKSATNGEGQTGGALLHARLEEPRSQDGEGRGGTEATAVRTEKENAASWQTRGETDAGRNRRGQ